MHYRHAPWSIISSNHKWFRNLAISRIVAEMLESLGMKSPEPTVNLDEIKQKYHAIGQEETKRGPAGGKKGKKSKKDKRSKST